MKTFFLLLFSLIPSLALAQASIEFKTETYDAGEVARGTKIEQVFEFVNAGTEDLLIRQLSAS